MKISSSIRVASLTVVALTALITGCDVVQVPANAVVDGWPIGDPLHCATRECAGYITVAEAGLARRDPGHAPIVNVDLFSQGVYRHDSGNFYVDACSGGCPSVAVFQLADGSVRAVGVGTPGISSDPIAFQWGPLLNWDPPPGRQRVETSG